ncbi:MAG: DUF4253 domain-containing protein [Omnitrophica WOR_2 bacterium]
MHKLELALAAIERINNLLHTTGSPYDLFENGNWVSTDCMQWPIPAEPCQTLTTVQKYQNLVKQLNERTQKDPDDPGIKPLQQQLFELLKPYKPTILHGVPVYSIRDLLRDDPYKGIQPYWWKARKLLQDQPVSVFTGSTVAKDTFQVGLEQLIVSPSSDPYAFLKLYRTNGINQGLTTAQVIENLKELDDRYGIVIVNASFDSVQFIFKRKLNRKESSKLQRWLVEFCPATEEPLESLMLGNITCWWD